jgi:hypothetical protein
MKQGKILTKWRGELIADQDEAKNVRMKSVNK